MWFDRDFWRIKAAFRYAFDITKFSPFLPKATAPAKLQIKMKFLIVLACVIVAALAAPAGDVEITKSSFENIGVDGYKFEYVLDYTKQRAQVKSVAKWLT